MLEYKTTIRVRYKETDQMAVVYYGNYFVWFEVARTELFRSVNCPYSKLEKELGLRLMVVEASCRYKAPAEYDDLVDIKCIVSHIGNSSIKFEYKVENDGKLIAEGETAHVFVDSFGKPKRIPSKVKEVLT